MLGFRLAGHRLSHRVAPGRLLEAAAACGLVGATPLTAPTSLWARVADLGTDAVERAVAERTLVETWSLRGTLHVFPATDLAVFTRSLLPADEEALRYAVRGAVPLLDGMGLTAGALSELAAAATAEALDHRMILGKPALDSAVASAMRASLPPRLGEAWDAPSPFAAGQTAGEALASFAFRLLGLRAAICLAGRERGRPVFARVEDCLPRTPMQETAAAGAALVRRYLRCYGPSTPEHFGQWAGTHPRHAAALWRACAAELVPVDAGGQPRWVHRADLEALRAAPRPAGLRLLPPLDPWVQTRDRELLAPPTQHHRVWRAAGWPGTVVHRGRIVALWRARSRGSLLRFDVDPLAPLGARARALLEREAQALALFRGHPGGAELAVVSA
ncbi:winged helix DNA-binding domain-containing protein [Sinomonas atrocyanea]|uniref:winged helix DNA-binding domain-containing protein n=1 Tax=Sinomonas atrocyanea TaxID=37927 RepID=UPI00277E636F|nr:winged helix DNA-binding domain-containing protein [Sinomonas atrocyanea]MDQ0259341.1 hypothetical protein [Sinomonas atrocyanea]MDR6621252.1 hypothetical protein [Sinomonas atrocyanea]